MIPGPGVAAGLPLVDSSGPNLSLATVTLPAQKRYTLHLCCVPASSGQNLRSLFARFCAPTLGHAEKKKQLPAVRWTAGAPGCTFERGEDGRYRWTMTGNDLAITLLVDSQELTKSRRRFYHLLGAYVSVTYTGQDKFEFPADVRIDFVRHHDVLEGFMDPTELSTKLQNDMDTLVFETERQIKKNPKITEEKTARLREYQKEAAEFIEFLSTQSLEPNAVDAELRAIPKPTAGSSSRPATSGSARGKSARILFSASG